MNWLLCRDITYVSPSQQWDHSVNVLNSVFWELWMCNVNTNSVSYTRTNCNRFGIRKGSTRMNSHITFTSHSFDTFIELIAFKCFGSISCDIFLILLPSQTNNVPIRQPCVCVCICNHLKKGDVQINCQIRIRVLFIPIFIFRFKSDKQ